MFGAKIVGDGIFPMPEILQPKDWAVEERTHEKRTPTSRGTSSMEVFVDDDERASALRLVQMGKLKFGPKVVNQKSLKNLGEDVQKELVILLEEVRIRERLQQAGFSEEIAPAGPIAQVPLTSNDSVSELTVNLLSHYGDESYAEVRQHLLTDEELGKTGKTAVKIVDWALGALTRGPHKPSFHRTVAVAREMSKVIKVSENQSKAIQQQCTSPTNKPQPNGKANWGKLLQVKEPRRTVEVPDLRRSAVVRSDENGAIMRTPYRVMIDQRVFRKILKKRSGTVMIDTSLSMSLHPEQINAIVREARGAMVCSYAGNGQDAEICILARDGRRVNDEIIAAPHGRWNGNNADGPILEWLGKQTAPRIWVTDGKVTGPHHEHTQAHVNDAVRICGLHKIRAVRTAEEARAALARRSYRRCA